MTQVSQFDLAVLGAGASGLMAAWQAAQRGARVVLVDRARLPGCKVRIAGGGKGNVTNRIMGPEWYIGEQPGFCRQILDTYPVARILNMLADLRIPLEEREAGQLFCLTPAAHLVEALVAAGHCCGVSLRLNHSLRNVEATGSGTFIIQCEDSAGSDTSPIQAAKLLIALGSPAWPQIGASDLGLKLARQWGHRIVPVRPVLAPLILPEDWPLHGLSGISLPARLQVGDRTFEQSLLFTHKGISGPAVFQASCFWRREMPLSINFLPHQSVNELMHQPEHGKLLVHSLFSRYLPARLAERLIPAALARRKVAETGKKERAALSAAVHAHNTVPLRSEGLHKAEAAAGGVATEHVDPCTLESRLQTGLFFAGEVLDVTGMLGGYNLHWAWVSGMAAGQGAWPGNGVTHLKQ